MFDLISKDPLPVQKYQDNSKINITTLNINQEVLTIYDKKYSETMYN